MKTAKKLEQIFVEDLRVLFGAFKTTINEKSWKFYFENDQSSEVEFMRVIIDIVVLSNYKKKTQRINNTKNIKIKVLYVDKSFVRIFNLILVFRRYSIK